MELRADFLVIGSGVAGLRAALSLSTAGTVAVLTKGASTESNTGYAQGGIAAAVGPDDSPSLHAQDTMAAGDGLCDADAVAALVTDGPRYVEELLAWGARFDRVASGAPALGREAAHSVRRVLHAKDATGREIGRVLWHRVSGDARVRVLEDALVVHLDVVDGVCVGATFLDREGRVSTARADRTLLATGGAGHVFRETTNPSVATGDGMAMAFEAGARVADLEFVQFHPTVLHAPNAPRFLLSEALRGEGGRLVNAAGDSFVSRTDPAGDLAPRDVVARAIANEIARTAAPVFLTMDALDPEFVRARFPTIAAACRQAGLDVATDRIPVSPAAHYVMGGVETDLDGRTSIAQLFAAGEVASTGVHGANRLASNSLLEGLVFGARAAEAMKLPARTPQLRAVAEPPVAWGDGASGGVPGIEDVQGLMWRHVGLLRDGAGLEQATIQLQAWYRRVSDARRRAPFDSSLRRLTSVVTVGALIAHAAWRRRESRGGHFRADFPHRDDLHWRRRLADARSMVPARTGTGAGQGTAVTVP